MVARARKTSETFQEYRNSLVSEERNTKESLRSKVIWETSRTVKNKPYSVKTHQFPIGYTIVTGSQKRASKRTTV